MRRVCSGGGAQRSRQVRDIRWCTGNAMKMLGVTEMKGTELHEEKTNSST